MIPKKIHYIWGNNEPKSKLAMACITSWHFFMPEYELIEWNESNLDFKQLANECEFFRIAYKYKIWAYVADYIRFKVIKQHGGIYLDTDVQLFRSLDEFTSYKFFAGFHDGFLHGRNTQELVEGAIFGSEAEHPFLYDIIEYFKNKMLKVDHSYLPYVINEILIEKYGLTPNQYNKRCTMEKGVELFPTDYFSPFLSGNYQTGKDLPNKLYAIHWHNNSYGDMKMKNYRVHMFMLHRTSSKYTRYKITFIFYCKMFLRPLYSLLKKILKNNA